MTGFDKLTNKINDDAKLAASEIISKANEEVARILAEYEAKKEAAHKEIFESALSSAESIKNIARARADREYNEIITKHKNDMISEVVDAAANEIVSFKDEKYIAFMSGLLANVMFAQLAYEKDRLDNHGEDIAPDKYVLLLRKRDRDAHGEKIIAALRRATVGKIPASVLDKVVLSNRTISVKGGFVLEVGDAKIDASIEAITENIKNVAGEDISKMLFEV